MCLDPASCCHLLLYSLVLLFSQQCWTPRGFPEISSHCTCHFLRDGSPVPTALPYGNGRLRQLTFCHFQCSLSRASGFFFSIYFLLSVFLADASHVSKQQLVSFLRVWQCEVTIISVLIRFQFDVALLQFLRNSTVVPWQPYQVCLFPFNVPFLTAA